MWAAKSKLRRAGIAPPVDAHQTFGYNTNMTKLEAILEQANGLSPVEREQLLHRLSAKAFGESVDDEAAVGKRGLAARTKSTQDEDWSMFYPDTLQNRGRALRP